MTQAVTLFALLELYKSGELVWRQRETFGEIEIMAGGPSQHESDSRAAGGAAVPLPRAGRPSPTWRRRSAVPSRGPGGRARRAARPLWPRASSGIVLREVSGGFTLASDPEADAAVRRLLAKPRTPPLSQAQAECLAIVAYLQPVSRPEIARIRGVNSDSPVSTLEERGLIEESGRTPVRRDPLPHDAAVREALRPRGAGRAARRQELRAECRGRRRSCATSCSRPGSSASADPTTIGGECSLHTTMNAFIPVVSRRHAGDLTARSDAALRQRPGWRPDDAGRQHAVPHPGDPHPLTGLLAGDRRDVRRDRLGLLAGDDVRRHRPGADAAVLDRAQHDRALSGLRSSRFGPTLPFVPASASVWQVPQDCSKICFPGVHRGSPRRRPPPPPPSPPPPCSPPPPPVSVVVCRFPPAPRRLRRRLRRRSRSRCHRSRSPGCRCRIRPATAPNASHAVGSERSRMPPRKSAAPISSRAQRTSKAAALCHGGRWVPPLRSIVGECDSPSSSHTPASPRGAAPSG